jgi:hypothetical protein
MLRVILDACPDALAAEAVADVVGMEASGGGFQNPLGRLHTLGLIEYPERGQVRAMPALFLGQPPRGPVDSPQAAVRDSIVARENTPEA